MQSHLFGLGENQRASDAAFQPALEPTAVQGKAVSASDGNLGYALIKSGPAVRSEEVESPHTSALEVMVLWGNTVLNVAHLEPPCSFVVGESSEPGCKVDYFIPREVLGCESLCLLETDATGPVLLIPAAAQGYIDFPGQARLTLGEARARATPSASVDGAHQLTLSQGCSARLELGAFALHISLVHAGRRVKKGVFAATDWNSAGFFGASFMAVGALMAAMAFFVPPMNLMGEQDLERERLYLINAILKSQAERERDKQEEAVKSDQPSDEGGTGERAQSDEGAMGSAVSRATNKRYSLKKTSDDDPTLARARGLEEVSTFGMLAILSGADRNAPTAPWGADRSNGLDDESQQGGMWGDEIGESFGGAGLGLSGLGEGGGGRGLGVGLGNIGLGHGAGLALAQGFGNGVGRSGGTHQAKAPGAVRMGIANVSGRLPPEVIQRIVRQNYGRFRMCYEQGLTKNPNLAGRVGVRFVIGREGTVQSAQNGGSDLPDSSVVGCVVSAFYGVTFPQPENGIVTVSYPIMFSPG